MGLVFASNGGAFAACDPTVDPDMTDIATARAAVEANCDCANAENHGAFVSCAAQTANTTLVNSSCAKYVKKCAARSTCGKPGAVTCCRTTEKGTKCKIARDEAKCLEKEGEPGTCTSCCDSCGDGTGPSCPVPTTTSTTTTTTTVP